MVHKTGYGSLFGQNYYWYNNNKIQLQIIPDKKFVLLKESVADKYTLKQILNDTEIEVLNFAESSVSHAIIPYGNNLEMLNGKKTAVIKKDNLNTSNFSNNQYIVYESPFYRLKGSDSKIGSSYLFYVKLFHEDDLIKLKALAQEHNVNILGNNKFMPLWYTLSCTKHSTGNALEMANLFNETGSFVYSEPDLLLNWTMQSNLHGNQCVDDYYFVDQWGLENWGQHGEDFVGIDINVCKAWEITQGCEDIIVAVIDTGIKMEHPNIPESFDHEDLPNMYPESYCNENGVAAAQEPHGTKVAGIIGAAKNNQKGIAGIAPDCPLMSISTVIWRFGETLEDFQQRIFNSFQWAWQNGASIINNSWGCNSFYGGSNFIDDGIESALELGRDGLGCIVVFATGNDASSNVHYPANSFQDIITVGAIEPSGNRANFSNYGTKLDVVAPGTSIYTTDYYAYHPGQSKYKSGLWGTSFAAPHVAGVAALILSVNPNLTVQEVNYIIESTARKVGDYNYEQTEGRPHGDWHVEMGYGLVDAYAALLKTCTQVFYAELDIEENETVHYKASETIIANNVIEPGANATYQAGSQIILQHGFHAKQGSNFHAHIAPCYNLGDGTKMLLTDNDPPPYFTNGTGQEQDEDETPDKELPETQYNYDFSVFPNPFDNSTTIKFSHNKTSQVKIHITNSYGQKVLLLHNQYTAPGNYEINLDGNALQPGVYFCVMETEQTREVVKIVRK